MFYMKVKEINEYDLKLQLILFYIINLTDYILQKKLSIKKLMD